MSSNNFFHNTKCLVTGSAGMIGSNFVQRLIKEGAKVYAVYNNTPPTKYKGDLQPEALVKANLEKELDTIYLCNGMDYVFHCSGKSYGAGSQDENALNLVGPNIKMNYNMLESARRAKVKKFIYLSSMTGYQDTPSHVKEDEFYNGDPADVYFGIGWVKRYSEKLCELFHKHLSDPLFCVVPRPSNIVGPRDCFDPKKSHVLPALVKKVADNNNPVEIWGDGHEERDFLHVDDFIDAVFLMVQKLKTFMPLNIAHGYSYTVNNIISLLRLYHKLGGDDGWRFDIKTNETKSTRIKSRRVDNSLAKSFLGWEPQKSINYIVSDVYHWYKEHVQRG